MPTPVLFKPGNNFWQTVQARLPANMGHAQNAFPHGPFVGTIGEVAFEEWFGANSPARSIKHVGNTWCDYVIEAQNAAANRAKPTPPPHPFSDISVEVKTKLRSGFSLAGTQYLGWEVSVPDYLLGHLQTTPKPEVIFAVSVQSPNSNPTQPNDITSIVIIGWIPFGAFLDHKVWIPAGTQMGGGRPSPLPMWNVFIRQLNDCTTL